MTATTLTSVDAFIRIAASKQRWHDEAHLFVLKYIGPERQNARQMKIIISRHEEIGLETWKQALSELDSFIEVEMSADNSDEPARVMIAGQWCTVTSVEHLI